MHTRLQCTHECTCRKSVIHIPRPGIATTVIVYCDGLAIKQHCGDGNYRDIPRNYTHIPRNHTYIPSISLGITSISLGITRISLRVTRISLRNTLAAYYTVGLRTPRNSLLAPHPEPFYLRHTYTVGLRTPSCSLLAPDIHPQPFYSQHTYPRNVVWIDVNMYVCMHVCMHVCCMYDVRGGYEENMRRI